MMRLLFCGHESHVCVHQNDGRLKHHDTRLAYLLHISVTTYDLQFATAAATVHLMIYLYAPPRARMRLLFCDHGCHARFPQMCGKLKYDNCYYQGNQKMYISAVSSFQKPILPSFTPSKSHYCHHYCDYRDIYLYACAFPPHAQMMMLLSGHECHIHVPQTCATLKHHNHFVTLTVSLRSPRLSQIKIQYSSLNYNLDIFVVVSQQM